MDGALQSVEVQLPLGWGYHPGKFPGVLSVTMDAELMFFAQWLKDTWGKK